MFWSTSRRATRRSSFQPRPPLGRTRLDRRAADSGDPTDDDAGGAKAGAPPETGSSARITPDLYRKCPAGCNRGATGMQHRALSIKS